MIYLTIAKTQTCKDFSTNILERQSPL